MDKRYVPKKKSQQVGRLAKRLKKLLVEMSKKHFDFHTGKLGYLYSPDHLMLDSLADEINYWIQWGDYDN